MKLGGGLLLMLLLLSFTNTPEIKEELNFKPNNNLTNYISIFSQGSIDHSGIRSLINPGSFKDLTLNITKDHDDLEKAIKIHEFIKNNIDYKPRFENINATQAFIDGWGDCSEMSLIAASMLESIGIDYYITNGNKHHYVIALINDYWVVIDPTQDFTLSQESWEHNIPENQLYLINSTTTLTAYASTTSAFA